MSKNQTYFFEMNFIRVEKCTGAFAVEASSKDEAEQILRESGEKKHGEGLTPINRLCIGQREYPVVLDDFQFDTENIQNITEEDALAIDMEEGAS